MANLESHGKGKGVQGCKTKKQVEYFQSTQIRCRIPEGLKIPLHSNVRWGTAFKMLNQVQRL